MPSASCFRRKRGRHFLFRVRVPRRRESDTLEPLGAGRRERGVGGSGG